MLRQNIARGFPRTPSTCTRWYSSSPVKLGKTFGEFDEESKSVSAMTSSEKGKGESSTNPSVISQIKENSMYKSFFEDFEKLKKESEASLARITSFEEQKSFKQVFDYLSKETNKVGVVKSLESFVNFQSPIQAKASTADLHSTAKKQSFFSSALGPINLEKQYASRTESNKKLIEALAPTFSYINKEIQTSTQLYNFLKNNVIQGFLLTLPPTKGSQKLKKSKKARVTDTIENIQAQSLKDPEHPIVNIQTLPVLLKFCLHSLTFDFNSYQTSMLIVDFIKKHESIELYGFGMNIDVYNDLLIQTWSKTGNLSLISQTIDELKINAIQPDLLTFKILAKIYLHCMRVKDSVNAEPYIIWNDAPHVHQIRDYLREFRLL